MLKVVPKTRVRPTRWRARCSTRSCGTTQDQLTHKHAPFELTLAGLLYHLALVEEDWMEVRFAGLPEREPRGSVDWDIDPDWGVPHRTRPPNRKGCGDGMEKPVSAAARSKPSRWP